MTDAKPNHYVELSLLGLLALLWSSSYLFTKIAVGEIPPVTLVAIRVSIAALVILAVLFAQGLSLPRDARTWGMLFIQSFCNSIGAWTLVAWGQQHIDSGLACVLNSTSPIFVFFITLLITRHEALNGLKLFGAILGLAGVMMIVGVDALRGLGQQVAGQLAALLGAFLFGIAAIYGKRFAHIPSVAVAAGTMLWASVVLIPAAFIVEQPLALRPSAKALWAAGALGVFCTGIAMLLYFRLVRTLGSLGVASQGYLRAGIGVLLGMVVLGEQITPVVGLGLLAAILGVAAINIRFPVRGGLKETVRP
jgi:drug/metabolite transporter (DMT)-like permease